MTSNKNIKKAKFWSEIVKVVTKASFPLAMYCFVGYIAYLDFLNLSGSAIKPVLMISDRGTALIIVLGFLGVLVTGNKAMDFVKSKFKK